MTIQYCRLQIQRWSLAYFQPSATELFAKCADIMWLFWGYHSCNLQMVVTVLYPIPLVVTVAKITGYWQLMVISLQLLLPWQQVA